MCQLKNKTEKSAIIKPKTKRAKKKDALRKRFGNLEQEGDANGLKARGIQNNPCKLSRGAAIAMGDVVHKDHK